MLRRAIGASLRRQFVAGGRPNYQGSVITSPARFEPKPLASELNPELERQFCKIVAAVGARVWDTYDDIVDACRHAWNFLINDPERIRSIGSRDWACVNL